MVPAGQAVHNVMGVIENLLELRYPPPNTARQYY
jgi:hypothetical protein